MIIRLESLLLLALAFSAASSALAQAPADKIVVPGNRVGPWGLEMSVQELTRMNGGTSTRPSLPSQYAPSTIWYEWDHLGIAAGSYDRRKVEFLAVYNTKEFLTQRGIGIGSPRRGVLAAYGSPELEGDIFVNNRIITVLIYNKAGMALFLDEDTVQLMLVFRPGDGTDLIVLC